MYTEHCVHNGRLYEVVHIKASKGLVAAKKERRISRKDH